MNRHHGFWKWVGTAWLAVVLTGSAALIRKEIPVRFSFENGNAHFDESTGWVSLVSWWSEFQGYVRASSIPYGFTASLRLVLEFDGTNVWAGNAFPCRVWLEPYDDPEITELYSDYGFELGVEFRNPWVGDITTGLTKDFRLNIQGSGSLPLGHTLLGGMDYVDFASIPVDELLPGSSAAVKVLQGMLKVADYTSLSIGSISLAGEVVVEGNHFNVYIGDRLLQFTELGEAHAQTPIIHVPIRDFSLDNQTFTFFVNPVYNVSIYKTIGVNLTVISPLSFTLTPSVLSRLSNILPGHYAPPNWNDLHDSDLYQKAVDGAGLLPDTPEIAVTLPVNQRPYMPDISVFDVCVNPENGWGLGRAYVGELTTVRFMVGNFGERATMANADWVNRFGVDGGPHQIELLNNRGFAPSMTLGVNMATQQYAFCTFTNAGQHRIYLSSGYLEYKGRDGNSRPIYGLGDGNLFNNVRTFTVNVLPQRGSVLGRISTNPDYPESGVNGIPVRLTGPYGAQTTISAPAEGWNGVFQFNFVPTGDYVLEYLPQPPHEPKDPDWWPRSFRFHHEAGDTDDFRSRGSMYMLRYQTLSGALRSLDNPTLVIADARVQLGEQRFGEVSTDKEGAFTFARVPPRGQFILKFDHPEYAPKQILVDVAVTETEQRTYPITRYYDFDQSAMVDATQIYLTPDRTAPTVELFPLDAGGTCTGVVTYAFRGVDDGGLRLPHEYRPRVLNLGGGTLLTGVWTAYPAPTGALDRVQAAWSLAGLAEGVYQLEVEVRDPARNGAVSGRQTFRIDRTPPAFTVAVAGGAASWYQYAAPVTVNLTVPEPAPWLLELSNDGVSWSAPQRFSGTSATIQEWALVAGRMEATGLTTVRARVTDAAGLSTVAQDGITVDMSGMIRLAYGQDYWFSTNVPFNVHIQPPDGDLVCQVNSYGGNLTLGDRPETLYRAQEFRLSTTSRVSRIKLWCGQIVGDPGPLHVKIVSALSDATPAGVTIRREWSGSVGDVRLSQDTYHFLYADVTPIVLTPGLYYLLFTAENTATNRYYALAKGNTSYGGNGWFRHDYANGHWSTVTADPLVGADNIQFTLMSLDLGDIRIATDGVCDTETWEPYVSPFPERTITWSTPGLHTICADYRHPSKHEKDGLYYDSVVLDWVPPVVHSVVIRDVDVPRGLLYLTADVTDAHSSVDTLLWSVAGGPLWGRSYAPEMTLPLVGVDSMVVYFGDRLGNLSTGTVVQAARDFFPPAVTLSNANGAVYTSDPEVALRLVSTDNVGVTRVHLRERRSGTDYGDFAGGTVTTTVTLPLFDLPDGKEDKEFPRPVHLDGEYVFTAIAYDACGHASPEATCRVVLDREPPVLQSVALTGPGGEPVAATTQMVLRVEAQDVIGPMEIHYRFMPSGTWSDWLPLQGGRAALPLNGAPGVVRYDVMIEVRDAAGHVQAGAVSLRVNHAPAQPGMASPIGLCGPNPWLVATPFSDPDGDAEGAVEFVLRAANQVEVFRSGAIDGTDRYLMPTGWLATGSNYNCNVRYSDAYGAWSPWSTARTLMVSTNQARLLVKSPYGQAVPATGTNRFDYSTLTNAWIAGSPVTAGATQYVCSGWTGSGSVPAGGRATGTERFTITNHSSIAWLWKTNYWLDTAVTGTGTVNVPDGWWLKGSNAQVFATAGVSSLFVGWSGQTSGCTVRSNAITAPMTAPRLVVANFVRGVVVTASADQPAGGTVTGGGVFMPGTNTVTLVARANTGWRFDRWSDGSTAATHATLRNLGSDTNFTARFIQRGTVTTKANPAAGGTVTGGGTYDVGTITTLVAKASTTWRFKQWENGLPLAARQITVAGNCTNTALFVHNVTISVVASPARGGWTTGGGVFETDTQVLLQAIHSNGWRFVKWNDGNASAVRPLTVTSAATYVANFVQLATLAPRAAPPEGGFVSGGGVYDVGTRVTLLAIPSNSWRFAKWENGLTTTSRVVTVAPGIATNTATFVRQARITAVADPVDGGTITGGGMVDTNALVTLRATARPNWTFVRWADTNLASSTRVFRAPADGATCTGLFAMVTGELKVSTNLLAFGSVPLGQVVTQKVAVTNLGPHAVRVTSITVPTGYSAVPTFFTLAPGGMTNLALIFKPIMVGVKTGTVSLASNAARGAATITVIGNGLTATRVIRLAGDLNFGTVRVGTTNSRPLTVANDGNSAMVVSLMTFSGTGSTAFRLPGLKVPFTVAAGGSTNLTVTFAPTAAASNRVTLTASVISKTGGTNTVVASGTGSLTVAAGAASASLDESAFEARVGATVGGGALVVRVSRLLWSPWAPESREMAAVFLLGGKAQVVRTDSTVADDAALAIALACYGADGDSDGIPDAVAAALGDRLTEGVKLLTVQYADGTVTVTTPFIDMLVVEGVPTPLAALPAAWLLSPDNE